jgi:hypothetical protein
MTELEQKKLGDILWDIADRLCTALTADFGKGFSYANLYNCRQFYLTFPDQAILYTACR